jgi:hypothetical protein
LTYYYEKIDLGGKTMAVEHIPTGEVHTGVKGAKAGCGVDTKKSVIIGRIQVK